MKKPFTPLTYIVTIALMLVVMAALSACGGQVATPTTIPAATPTTMPTTVPATPTTEATAIPATTTPTADGQPTIKFETTGTIAGVHQTLDLNASGAANFDDGRNPATQGTITAQQYADLVAQISKADFFNLKDRYDNGNVADDRYYTITVTQGAQTKSVTVAEEGGKGLTPQALLDLVTMLNSIQSGM